MEKKVLEFMKKNDLIRNEPIICATSGGVDSVCLLTILHQLGFSVILAHVNHHKREESVIEERAMKKLAEDFGIPFELLNFYYDGTDNFHNASHNARYDFFKSLCETYHTSTIATAHHSDDQLETILIKLMEGSNLFGYGGISSCHSDGKYRIIRPLLCVSKEELYEYASEKNLTYFEDSSNAEDIFLRNRLRHHVIPLLKQECHDIHKKVMQYSVQLKEAFAFIRDKSIDYLNQTNNTIKLDSFGKLDIALKKDILSLLFERYSIRKNNTIISSALGLLCESCGNKELHLENGYILRKSYDTAYIDRIALTPVKPQLIGIDDEVIFLKYKFYFSKKIPLHNAKYIKLWYNNLELPFTVRPWNTGDTIELPIGHKKVNRIFIDCKIPKNDRKRIPIITDNRQSLLWIYDLAKSKEVYSQKNNGDIYFVCEEVENA